MKPSEIIRQRGWCQGAAENARGNVCLSRAIFFAYRDDSRACDALCKLLTEKLGVTTMWEWNDVKDRTMEEVIELLESVGQ